MSFPFTTAEGSPTFLARDVDIQFYCRADQSAKAQEQARNGLKTWTMAELEAGTSQCQADMEDDVRLRRLLYAGVAVTGVAAVWWFWRRH